MGQETSSTSHSGGVSGANRETKRDAGQKFRHKVRNSTSARRTGPGGSGERHRKLYCTWVVEEEEMMRCCSA